MKKLIDFSVRRFAEIFFYSVALSALVSLLCVMDILPDRSKELVVGLYAAVIVFLIINIIKFRLSYCVLKSYKKYLIVNVCAYGLFMLATVIAYKLFSPALYTWIFAITKAGRYTNFRLATVYSAAILHFIMLVVMFISPIGLGWVKEKKREKEEFIARMPGMLEVNPLEQKPKKEVEANDVQKETEENSVS